MVYNLNDFEGKHCYSTQQQVLHLQHLQQNKKHLQPIFTEHQVIIKISKIFNFFKKLLLVIFFGETHIEFPFSIRME